MLLVLSLQMVAMKAFEASFSLPNFAFTSSLMSTSSKGFTQAKVVAWL
jgi:hypothetical protein